MSVSPHTPPFQILPRASSNSASEHHRYRLLASNTVRLATISKTCTRRQAVQSACIRVVPHATTWKRAVLCMPGTCANAHTRTHTYTKTQAHIHTHGKSQVLIRLCRFFTFLQFQFENLCHEASAAIMPHWMWTVCQHGSVDLRKEEEEAIGTLEGRCSSSPCREKPFAYGDFTLEFREEPLEFKEERFAR